MRRRLDVPAPASAVPRLPAIAVSEAEMAELVAAKIRITAKWVAVDRLLHEPRSAAFREGFARAEARLSGR